MSFLYPYDTAWINPDVHTPEEIEDLTAQEEAQGRKVLRNEYEEQAVQNEREERIEHFLGVIRVLIEAGYNERGLAQLMSESSIRPLGGLSLAEYFMENDGPDAWKDAMEFAEGLRDG